MDLWASIEYVMHLMVRIKCSQSKIQLNIKYIEILFDADDDSGFDDRVEKER